METVLQPRARRPRPKVVTLTDAAAERVREIMARAEKPYAGLRVGVKNGGCAGQEYVLEYAETADALDEVVEDKGVTILIEPKAVLFLIGTEIDYEVTQARRPSSSSATPTRPTPAAAAKASPSSRRARSLKVSRALV